MKAHTPGPWEVDEPYGGDIRSNAGNIALTLFRGMGIIGVTGQESSLAEIGCEEAQANARLIAAAPELLEALNAFVEFFAPQYYMNSGGEFQKVRADALAAIAKATGAP